jgi:hypothetical protein
MIAVRFISSMAVMLAGIFGGEAAISHFGVPGTRAYLLGVLAGAFLPYLCARICPYILRVTGTIEWVRK